MARTESLTQSHLQRLLLLGLGLSAILLLSALLIAIRTVHQINTNTQTFADQEAAAKAAIDDIQNQQAQLNNRWLRLARRKDALSREEVLDQLAENRNQMNSALESAYRRAELLRETIYQKGHGLLRWTVWLFSACVILSIFWASWTVRATTGLFRRLEQQATELSRLQFQFLESQEDVARRFSHELHDELGQALTAIKANLSGLRGDEGRLQDCRVLVDQAIHDVREMSQLLRPMILDDFGLDAALRSLTEGFAQRTGIQVSYRSDLDGRRLPGQVETSLFRIAQEALTNIARHAQATTVSMELLSHGEEVSLRIQDNGRGFEVTERRRSGGLGLAGMETRARGCGGTLSLESTPGKGSTIEVNVSSPVTSLS